MRCQSRDLGPSGVDAHAGCEPCVDIEHVPEDQLAAVVELAQRVRVQRCPGGNFLVDRVRKGTGCQDTDNRHEFPPITSHEAHEVPSDDVRVPAVERCPGAVTEHDDRWRSRSFVRFIWHAPENGRCAKEREQRG
jgi:hypothetical protein